MSKKDIQKNLLESNEDSKRGSVVPDIDTSLHYEPGSMLNSTETVNVRFVYEGLAAILKNQNLDENNWKFNLTSKEWEDVRDNDNFEFLAGKTIENYIIDDLDGDTDKFLIDIDSMNRTILGGKLHIELYSLNKAIETFQESNSAYSMYIGING